VEAQKAAERAESAEYFRTLGGFTGVAIGGFVALTQLAGLEDVQAGNLVLVALCAYGAYLLFFDGGVTQAALEKQAIQQLAEEEASVMASAPRAEVGIFEGTAAAAAPVTVAAALIDAGFVRLNGLLSDETAAALLVHVSGQLEEKRKEAAADMNAETKYFGDVLMRYNRYDLLLDLEAPVRAALAEALPTLKRVFAHTLGGDAELFELSAVIADPGAPRQPMHPGTAFRAGDPDAAVVTAFVALQDVTEDMGPTCIIPGTATAEAHARFNDLADGGRERIALLREMPNHVGTLARGDANLMDSRLFRAGGSNDSPKRRVLFYISFRRRGKVMPSGSLLYKLRRAGYALDNTEQWAVP